MTYKNRTDSKTLECKGCSPCQNLKCQNLTQCSGINPLTGGRLICLDCSCRYDKFLKERISRYDNFLKERIRNKPKLLSNIKPKPKLLSNIKPKPKAIAIKPKLYVRKKFIKRNEKSKKKSMKEKEIIMGEENNNYNKSFSKWELSLGNFSFSIEVNLLFLIIILGLSFLLTR